MKSKRKYTKTFEQLIALSVISEWSLWSTKINSILNMRVIKVALALFLMPVNSETLKRGLFWKDLLKWSQLYGLISDRTSSIFRKLNHGFKTQFRGLILRSEFSWVRPLYFFLYFSEQIWTRRSPPLISLIKELYPTAVYLMWQVIMKAMNFTLRVVF